MKVVIFGAAGKTGSLVVEKALAAGHTVRAITHSAEHSFPQGVEVLTGDAKEAAFVRRAVAGQDAVIDAIGGTTPYKKTDLEGSAAQTIIDAMQAEHVRRLVVISMMGIGDSAEQAPFWYEHLLQPTFLRGTTPDKTAMEAEVQGSGLEFVIARPPLLTDDPAKGSVMVIPSGSKAHKITRENLAGFLVDQLTTDLYVGQAVVVANR